MLAEIHLSIHPSDISLSVWKHLRNKKVSIKHKLASDIQKELHELSRAGFSSYIEVAVFLETSGWSEP